LKSFYLGFNRIYLNPWTEQVLSSFRATTRLEVCGPNFSKSIDYLERNIEDGDLLIVDSLLLEHKKFKQISRPFGSSYFGGKQENLPVDLSRMVSVFERFQGKKVFIANLDYYGASAELTNYVKRNDIYVVSMSDMNTTSDYSNVDLRDSVISYANPTSNWFSLVTERPELIISFPHFIDDSEFICATLNEKEYFCDIPGVMYEDRRAAERCLSFRDRARLAAYRIKRILDFLPNKLKGNLTYKKVKMLNLNFRLRIFNTKFVYTCGSLFDFPIRKFFEIPSQSSVLVCKPFVGMKHLGFENGITHMGAENLKNLHDGMVGVDVQRVAHAGFELIRTKHSSTARAQQLKKCIDRIQSGSFTGSRWHNGHYEV